MPAAWPGALPSLPTYVGSSETPPDTTLRTPMDAGPAKVRRRFTSGPRVLPIRLVMTATQLNAATPNGFDAFFVTDTSGGADEWTWTNPRTGGAVTMRFVGTPTYVNLGGTAWEVSFTVEILP
jgi:hypothetical protein